jgi:Protein of unknown function (DUF2809)
MSTDARPGAAPAARAPRPRWRIALAAVLTIPLGLLTRSGLPLPELIRTYGGDTLYATLVCFLVALLWRRAAAWRLALLAFGLCVAVELSQLAHTPWLEALRRTLFGRLVLGSGFLWSDLVCYAAGALLGWGLLLTITPPAAPSGGDAGMG